MSQENQALTKAEETMVAEISPFQKKSNALYEQALSVEVKDEKSLAAAVALKKEITSHRTFVKDVRLGITRKIDDLKKAIMNKEDEVLLPLDKAQTDVGEKILHYQEEQERIRAAEQARVDTLVNSVSMGDPYGLKTVEAVDTKAAEYKKVHETMAEADRELPDVKLAYTQTVNKLADRRAYILEEIRQAEVRAEQEKKSKEQSEAQAKIDEERAANEAKERKIQDEKDRLEREKQRKADEEAAEEARKKRERDEKNTVKTGVRTVTTIEITNPELVPRQYCVPSESLIREAVKAGVEVPGVTVTTSKKV